MFFEEKLSMLNMSKLAVLALCGVVSSAAQAAVVIFDDTVPGEISVYANDFEWGASLNGDFFQLGLGNAANATIAGEGPVTFQGQWIDDGFSATENRTVYFVDAGNNTFVNGMLTYSRYTDGWDGFMTATYTSTATAGGLGLVPFGTDPSDIHVVGSGDFYFDGAFISGLVYTAVPAPGALALVGMGGLMVARRRR
jgi:hypothetical protein